MPLIGLHLEGRQDERVFEALLTGLLKLGPGVLTFKRLSQRASGYQDVITKLPVALANFWEQGASGVVVGVDNDGEPRVVSGAFSPDPHRPRHTHDHVPVSTAKCRYCRLVDAVEQRRATLRHRGRRRPSAWPVVIAVPVEALESWLLWGADMVDRRRERRPEDLPKSQLKQRLYDRPHATRQDVETIAVPIAEQMDLDGLRRDVESFHLFAEAVEANRDLLLTEPEEQN